MQIIGMYAVPVLLALTGALMLFSKNDLGAEFIKGCREGLATSFRLLPSLVMLFCASRMFASSGALETLVRVCEPLLRPLGIPKELLPILILRPISGSGTTAMINELFREVGPDSFVGRCASILSGSSDTILYTFALYFGSVGVRRTRHAFPVAFLMLVFCAVLSVVLTRMFFS